jgi:hypothetical protein
MKLQLSLVGSLVTLLLLVSACGESDKVPLPKPIYPVHINETDSNVDSPVKSFSPDRIYHFIVTNKGKTAHGFMIVPTSDDNPQEVPTGDLHRIALASIDTINPGETKTLDYAFLYSAMGSRPLFVANLPGHYKPLIQLRVTVS